MLQFDNRWKVLQVFFDEPTVEGGHQLREISRKIKLALPSVKRYLLNLEKEKLIIKKKHRIQGTPIYVADRDNFLFKFYRRIDILIRINHSGLLEKIKDECMPNAIIFFGSAAKGEDTESSDIDLYVASAHKNIALDAYEKQLRRKINILFESNFSKLSPELKNNLLNGTKLLGYIKVF